MSRIEPLEPPYSPDVQELFDLAMPDGMAPLLLFRVLAKNDRIFPRFMRSGVLDRGPVPIRDREIVIHRTTARCGAEYEWGVHAAGFGRPLGLGDDVLRATVDGKAEDPAFDVRQALLVRMVDELHDTSTLSEETWGALRDAYDEAQLQELVYTVGFYHTVSFFCNGFRLENESFGATFAELRAATG